MLKLIEASVRNRIVVQPQNISPNWFTNYWAVWRTSQVVLVVKNAAANAGDARNTSLIPVSERFSGEGNGSSRQHSHLGNPMDRRAWRATVHGVAKSWTRLSDWTELNKWIRCTFLRSEDFPTTHPNVENVSRSAVSESLRPQGL